MSSPFLSVYYILVIYKYYKTSYVTTTFLFNMSFILRVSCLLFLRVAVMLKTILYFFCKVKYKHVNYCMM